MSSSKAQVWSNIVQLIVPQWRKFVLIVFIGLLATGASLVEPLIYREAINDVAGLFIQKAKDETRQKYEPSSDTTQTESDDSEIDFIIKKIIPKEPHTRHEVAGRTPEQAIQT